MRNIDKLTLMWSNNLKIFNTSKTFHLTDEVWDEYSPIITDFIAKIEAADPNQEIDDEDLVLDLSCTTVNPYTLGKILENMGYKKTNFRSNGWEFDFWMDFEKPGCKTLLAWGTGITFNLWLQKSDKY